MEIRISRCKNWLRLQAVCFYCLHKCLIVCVLFSVGSRSILITYCRALSIEVETSYIVNPYDVYVTPTCSTNGISSIYTLTVLQI